MRIAKKFTGHAAAILRSLLKHYKPPTKTDIMFKLYDPAEDGPEVDTIRFFYHHPYGKTGGIKRCLHL